MTTLNKPLLLRVADYIERHRAAVTYDRLVDASERWSDKLDGHEKDAIGEVCQALWEIAEGQR
jgi:hypothetical protein